MKEFWSMIKRYVAPFKKYLAGSVVLNILSAVFNIFSFAIIVPILRILFKINETVYSFTPWDEVWNMPFKDLGDAFMANVYWMLEQQISAVGASTVLLYLCIFLVVMTALKTACYFGSSAVMVPIRTGVVKNIRMDIYNKILALPLGFFSEEKKGDIIARMSGDVQEVENSITGSIEMLIKNPILILFYFAALLVISWQMTAFTILFAPLMMWVMGVVGKNLKRKSLEVQQLWSDVMAQVEETLGGLRIIKAFIAEKKMSDRFDNVTEAMRKKSNRVTIRQSLAHPMSEFLGTVLIMIVLWFGGALILGGKSTIDAPIFIYYMVILYSIINPIKDFAKAGYAIPKGMASMERINKILDAENDIVEPEHPKTLNGFNDKLSFNHVNFRYPDGHRMILEDVSLEIPKGKTIAIVGASGAGKSTLVDLIPRFYDPTGGSITIDGTNIKDVRISDLRSLIGNVNQESILFNDTIFNNIAFGVENATMESVIEAAKIANAHDFIMEKEGGYNFNIGDRGVKLSGGQRQRISIARAILKNPPILILDEATASLDTESEKIVQEALDRLMSSRTTIAIAHRLSTIRNADEIIVMDEGHIVERGKHEQLLALNGYYRKLNDMQAL
ncbi:MAG TPA: antibiotic ABC transporter ATP-binding protein [Rikenellaceae bacterium]|nr:antibiotic ABC transporter ATP-binding protein [Rikenellaceae bacterium]